MKYGLIGKTLKHSFSKEIHERIAGYGYELSEIAPEDLGVFLKKADFSGINVTIPYKETVMPYLDGISDEAKKIGCVNTVINRGGKLFGYNTDYYGLKSLILKNGIDVSGKKALIMGGGGTYRTAKAVLSDLGAKEIIRVGLERQSPDVLYGDAAKRHADAKFILNATPVGMFPDCGGKLLSLADFPELEGYIDCVYNPLRTETVSEGIRLGKKAEGGLYMLVKQAEKAAELFMGEDFNGASDGIYEDLLREKENIVLIGMPSSGKSTVGKIVAEKSGKKFVDTDELVLSEIKTPIKDYFEEYGEESFRKIEKSVVEKISSQNSLVIATGGGVPLSYGNVNALKRNGRVYFIDRSPENLVPTSDRPTARTRSAIEELYKKRYAVYLASADVRTDGDRTAEKVAADILNEFYGKRE